MCRLKFKIRIIGKKNQSFVRFIAVPKKRRQRGLYKSTIGYWDIRPNRQLRFINLDIYKIMYLYSYGATPNKNTLHHIFAFFNDLKHFYNWLYFKEFHLRFLVENEIKKKYL